MGILPKSIGRYLFQKFKENETKIHELRYLFWECTLRCNLSCLHCGSDCNVSAETENMPAEIFLAEIRKVSKVYEPQLITIVFTGGEPLLRADLEDVGREVRKLGFHWAIVTNGLIYSPERHKNLMGAGMGSATLSIDGLEEEHNWLRNSGNSFSKAIQALELMNNESRLNFDVVTCVNPKNINKLEEIGNFLAEKNLKSWRLFTIAPKGRAKGNEALHLNNIELRKLMEFIQKNRKIGNMKITFSCEGYVGPYEGKVRDGYFFCRAGIHIGSILADGSVGACPNIDRTLAQGNIYQTPFVDLWENNFGKMRNRIWTKTGECANCKEYQHCQGSAMHLWNIEKNELLFCHTKALVE